MNDTVVRPARSEDLAVLAERLAPLPLFTAYKLSADRLCERWQQALQAQDGLLVADSAELGLSGICWYLRRGTFASGAYLRTLALAPNVQGRGLGPRLLRGYEDGAGRPPGGYFLLASDFNDGAHRFYQRHGYVQVGRLPPGFAAGPIAELIFWKPLPPSP